MKRTKSRNGKTEEPDPEINPLNRRPFSAHYHALQAKILQLPVLKHRDEVVQALENNRVVVLEGATGSGKTTQIPKFCLSEAISGGKRVCCTQPRRVAAISVARRVAEELDVELGAEVGYSVRFDDCRCDDTRLVYMTDGMLLREMMADASVSQYGVILLDEAHERTVATDILFGVLKGLLETRADLRLVVMSATLEASKFREYFDNAPHLSVEGRTYPVEIEWSPRPEQDYFEAAFQTLLKIDRMDEGDVLVFMTGEDEIEEMCERVNSRKTKSHMIALPLYAALPQAEQQRVFDKVDGRKVIVATNIAETSITIDGIVYVIDTGYVKQKVYLPSTRVETLQVTPISKASAQQRSGRAGRTRPGKCFRLYTKQGYEESLPNQTIPEMLRSNLSTVVLHMMRIGIRDIPHFDYIDPPTPQVLIRALEQLNYLGAVDTACNLTALGEKIAEIPVEPQLACALVAATGFGVFFDVCKIVALLSVPAVFLRPKGREEQADTKRLAFEDHESDHITLMNAFDEFINNGEDIRWCRENFLQARSLNHAKAINDQLISVCGRLGLLDNLQEVEETRARKEGIKKALCRGFFMQSAHGVKGGYEIVRENQVVLLHPSSGVGKRDWVIYNEYVMTKRQYVRTVTAVRVEWILEAGGRYFDHLAKFKPSETTRALQRAKRAN